MVAINEPAELYPGVFTTGEMGDEIREQALVVETPAGAELVTGCSHPGIVEILHRAQEISDLPIDLVVGGFHLGNHSPDQITAIVEEFRRQEVRQVIPAHCTGEEAQARFAEVYGDAYSIGGAGLVLSFN